MERIKTKLRGMRGMLAMLALPFALVAANEAYGRSCDECTDEYNSCASDAFNEYIDCLFYDESSIPELCEYYYSYDMSVCHSDWNSCWSDCDY